MDFRFVLFVLATISELCHGAVDYCYQCLDGEMTGFCVMQETVTQCVLNEGSCFNQVRHERGGLVSHKGCMETWVCAEKERQNPSECYDGVVTDKCTFCCQEEYCNRDIYTYSVTRPPPTTTTTTTTTAATTTSLQPTTTPTKTFLEELGKCMAVYKQNVITVLVDPREQFVQFCSNVSTVFNCVSSALPQCDENLDVMSILVEFIGDSLEEACPTRCNPKQGIECTAETQIRIVRAIFDPSGTCVHLKREVITMKRCVVYSTYQCRTVVHKIYEYTMKSIDIAIEKVCEEMDKANSTTEMPTTVETITTTETPTTTEAPKPCSVTTALACLADYANDVVRAKATGRDFTTLCTEDLDYAITCALSNTELCNDQVKKRVQLAINYVKSLVEDKCTSDNSTTLSRTTTMMMTTTPTTMPTTTEPLCDTKAARGCILELWTLIEQVKDFEKACNSIDSTIQCVVDQTVGCTVVEQTSLNKSLSNILNLIGNRCDDVAKCPTNSSIVIREGGEAVWLEYSFTRNPSTLCKEKGCRVFIDIIPESHQGPYCRNRYPISQIVIGGDGTDLCTTEITADNWNKPHKFSISAKIDFVLDGNQTRNVSIVMRKVVNGVSKEVREICEVQVLIIDRDIKQHTCRSFNDPHLVSFDGLKFNNMQTGFFTLYRHQTLPYQVQVAYYGCRHGASCNCGAAVQSGDTVFVVDLCNKRSKKQLCKNERYFCHDNTQQVRLYYHDRVTPGTRLFRTKGGKQYDMYLPTGTIVRIRLLGYQVNVDVVASPFDWEQSEGLCGWYDGNMANDLRRPDGTVLHKLGVWSAGQNIRNRLGYKREANGFNRFWSLPSTERIFYSVPKDPYNPYKYCECRQSIDNYDGAPYSNCEGNPLLELCDVDTRTEVTLELPRQRSQHSYRNKRQASDPYEDWDVAPNTQDPGPSDWTESTALVFCQEFLVANSTVVRRCVKELSFDPQPLVLSCAEDIMFAGDTSFAQITLDILKSMCIDDLKSNVNFTNSEDGKELLEEMEALDCPMDCSNNGQCVDGTCECHDGFRGDDCSLSGPSVPIDLYIENEGLCDSQETSCDRVVVMGAGFELTDNATCHFYPIKIEGHPVKSTQISTQPAIYLTPNQVLCHLPGGGAPHDVSVSNDGVTPATPPRRFIPYDSVCYNCLVAGDGEASCERKPDNCMIDGQCYGPGSMDPHDDCNACDPHSQDSQWTRSKSSTCWENRTFIIAIICIVLFLLLLFIVICVCVWCCRKKRKEKESRVSFKKNEAFGQREATDQESVQLQHKNDYTC